MADDCFEKLINPEVMKALFGDRKMPKEMLKRFADDVEAMRIAADKAGDSFESKVQKYIKQKKEETQVQKAIAANDIRLGKERMKYYLQPGFEKDPVEAFQAKLTFSRRLGNDARYSASAVGAATTHYHLNALYGEVMKFGPAHWKAFEGGTIDLDIRTETKQLALGKPFKTENKMAQEIAQAVHGANKRIYDEHLRSGVPLRDLPGFTASITHDVGSMRKTGKAGWIEQVHKLDLDRERTFGKDAGNPDAEKAILGRIYDKITHETPASKNDIPFEEGMGLSYTRRLTEARAIHFLSAEGEHAYNIDYGQGSFAEGVINGITSKSKQLGLVKIFGANPEKALLSDIAKVVKHYESNGKPELADALKRHTEHIRATFLAVSGATSKTGINTGAKISETIRNNNVLAMLGYTGVRSMANFPTMAMQLHDYTGKNFFEHLGKGMKDWFGSLKEENRVEIANAAGFFLNDLNDTIKSQTFGDQVTGVQGKLARLMFKMNGMDLLNRGFKHTFAKTFMTEVGHNVGKELKDTHPHFQATMLSAGIQEPDYKILAHARETMADGRVMVTAEGITNLDPALVKERAKELRISPSRYINDLRDRYLGLLQIGADASSTTAGARENALIVGQTFKGTWEGEIRRFVGQFKTFWAQGYNLMLQNMNSKPDLELLKQGVLSSKGINPQVASWMVASTAFGYMGQALIDMAKGKNPKDPRAVETWMDAFAKGGAGGMYADLLMPDYSWTGMSESLLGPTMGQLAGPAAKMFSEAKKDVLDDKPGFQKTVKNQATRLIRNNIPFNQVPGLAQGFDALQFGVIQESLTPGYMSKKSIEARKEVQKGKRLDVFE